MIWPRRSRARLDFYCVKRPTGLLWIFALQKCRLRLGLWSEECRGATAQILCPAIAGRTAPYHRRIRRRPPSGPLLSRLQDPPRSRRSRRVVAVRTHHLPAERTIRTQVSSRTARQLRTFRTRPRLSAYYPWGDPYTPFAHPEGLTASRAQVFYPCPGRAAYPVPGRSCGAAPPAAWHPRLYQGGRPSPAPPYYLRSAPSARSIRQFLCAPTGG